MLVGLGVGVHANHARRRCGRARRSRSPHRRPCRSRAGRPAARGDPLVDDQMAAIPVVLLRHVGQRALAGQRQRGHPVRLIALEEDRGWSELKRWHLSVGSSPRGGGAITAREYMVRPVPPSSERRGDPRRRTPATTTWRPATTTPSGASTSASSGMSQVTAKLRKALGSEPGHYPRSLEIGAGTGYFTLNLLRAGLIGAGHLQRHLAGNAGDPAPPTRTSWGSRSAPSRPTPSTCRSPTRASIWCSATPCCTTSPTCSAPSPSSSGCSRRAAP